MIAIKILDINKFADELSHCRADGNKLHIGGRVVTFTTEDGAFIAEGIEAACWMMRRKLEIANASNNGGDK